MTFILISPPLLSQAREITQATGLDEASAVIQDADGNILSHDAVLPESSEYTVNYKWAIPNGVLVFSGDTMTVQVPTNVKIPADDRFTMTNTSSGKSIGTFFIAAGSHTGTVTLNSTFTFYPLNRQGYIHLAVTGTEPNVPDPIPDVPITVSKTAAWADSTTQTHINWGIDIAANGNVLTSPVITDTLSVNQTYVPDSAKLTDEYGNVVSVEPTISGSVLTFNINGSFVNQLKLTYQTTTNEPAGTAVFKNQADYKDSAGNSGSASATIERIDSTPDGSNENDTPTTTPEQPGTTEPEQPGTTEP
ncbi:Ig-like domain-containing protein, partial [Lactiplantibacillus plajomi]